MVKEKVIFILIDGLSFAASRQCMSFMRALTEAGKMGQSRLQAVLPPISRPAYASFLTGKTPLENEILYNGQRHLPLKNTFFSAAADAGMRTAAVAYGWFYELCCGENFNLSTHRFWDNSGTAIQKALFYGSDSYPDPEVFADAEALRQLYSPQLLMVHSMGADYAGHKSGADSCLYREAVRGIDGLLAVYLPSWLNEGYKIMCISDHGMNDEGSHYDADSDCCDIPLWVDRSWPIESIPASPLQVRASILSALGLSDD